MLTTVTTLALDEILAKLPSAAEAPFNSSQKQNEPTCLENTRVDLLKDIYHWGEAESEEHTIYWLNGMAGTGKSTIARTVARKYQDEGRLGASFFFERNGGDLSNASKFFTSIALQLGRKSPSLRQSICNTLTKIADIASQAMRDQWQHLILNPLVTCSKDDPDHSFYVLVVDAIDECADENHIHIILQLLAEAQSLPNRMLRIFITSRPETPIRHGLRQISGLQYRNSVLHTISPAVVEADIARYLQHNLGITAEKLYLSPQWPSKETIDILVQKAAGLFVWASTACRFISEGKRFAERRLNLILENSHSSVVGPEKHLDEIYIAILKQCISSNYMEEEVQELCLSLRQILGSLVLLFAPLPAQSLSSLLQVRKEDIYLTLDDLRSIVNVPEDQKIPLSLHHLSFHDFLTSRERCYDTRFLVDVTTSHLNLARSCLELLSGFLTQDICKINGFGAEVRDVDDDQIGFYFPTEVQYACLYWVSHLVKSKIQLYDNDQIHKFLQVHFLHWLEALCWMRELSSGIRAIEALDSTVESNKCPNLQGFVYDMKRFALYNRTVIQHSPLQLYYGAIAFAPKTSLVRMQFEYVINQAGRFFGGKTSWDALLSASEFQSGDDDYGRITSAFSPDSKVLASCGSFGIKLLDTGSGETVQTLSSSSDVNNISFSPDSRFLASVSDTELILWDARSGADLLISKPRTGYAHGRCIVFSPDCRLASVAKSLSTSEEENITLWEFGLEDKSMVARQTFNVAPFGEISSLAFSPDGKVLASSYLTTTEVNLWKVNSRRRRSSKPLQSLDDHSYGVKTVVFSQNGKLLASGSYRSTIILWDVRLETGPSTILYSITTMFRISVLEFSLNSEVLMSLAEFGEIEQWDIRNDPEQAVALELLEGAQETHPISPVISPNNKLLATGWEKTVKLWDFDLLAASASDQESEVSSNDTRDIWRMSILAPNGKLAMSISDNSLKLWEVSSGILLYTLEYRYNFFSRALFSPNSEMILIYDIGRAFLIQANLGIVIWELEFEQDSSIRVIEFSPDSELLATLSATSAGIPSLRLWNISSRDIFELKLSLDEIQSPSYKYGVRYMAFSSDGQLLASCPYSTGRIDLFRVDSGDLLRGLETSSSLELSLEEDPVMDKQLEEIHPTEVQWVESHSDWDNPEWEDLDSTNSDKDASHESEQSSGYFTNFHFSPGDKLLAAVWQSYVILWDVGSGELLYKFSHGKDVCRMFFWTDDSLLVSASSCRIRLWDTSSGLNLRSVEVQPEDTDIFKLQISDDNEYIHDSKRVVLSKSHSEDMVLLRNTQFPLHLDGQWILKGTQKLVWVPSEYNRGEILSHGNTVVLSSQFGDILFLNFSASLFEGKRSRLAIRV
jgi:WD40 repeat protein